MRKGTKHGIIFIFFTLLVILSLAFSSFAKSSGKTKTVKQITGYCVNHGRILKTTESACEKQHGKFFKDKKTALAYLDAQTPGYCCLDGKVLSMKKGDCRKKRGHFFTGKKAAAEYCDAQTSGWCCLDGKVLSLKKGNCLEKKGRFFKEKKAAAAWCDLHQQGYCCLKGRIFPAAKGDCLRKNGKFFKDKQTATKTCVPRGWCVLKGKIQHLTRKACKEKQGRYFSKKQDAVRFLRAGKKKQGYPGTKQVKTPAGKGIGSTGSIGQSGKHVSAGRVMPRYGALGTMSGHVNRNHFPAVITSIEPRSASVGDQIILHGRDFGRNTGRVDVLLPGQQFPCEISQWTDRRIRCTIPIAMAEAVGTRPRDAVLWVKPARVDPPAPGTVSLPGPGGAHKKTYYYSGEEGPMRPFSLQPMIPQIESLSRTSISPLQDLTIRGRNFGDTQGQLRFNVPGERYPYQIHILSWSNTRIMTLLTDTTASSYGDMSNTLYSGERRLAHLSVQNNAGNSQRTDILFVPGSAEDHSPIDLYIPHVKITRQPREDGGTRLRILVTVENTRPGRTWNRFKILLSGRGISQASWIEGGIGPYQKKDISFIHRDSPSGDTLDFDVVVDSDHVITETDEHDNTLHINWRSTDRERDYVYPRL